jgi:long-subunit acyl-CoA synthetase (AMP-forming)
MQLVPFSDDPADDDSLLRVDKLIGTERPVACSPPADQNVPVLIAYTSGTTGTPKGAVYTQDAITFSAINSNTSFNMRSRDHVLTFLPMFHVGGLLIQTLPAFHVGATVTIHRTFDAGKVLRAISRQRSDVDSSATGNVEGAILTSGLARDQPFQHPLRRDRLDHCIG